MAAYDVRPSVRMRPSGMTENAGRETNGQKTGMKLLDMKLLDVKM